MEWQPHLITAVLIQVLRRSLSSKHQEKCDAPGSSSRLTDLMIDNHVSAWSLRLRSPQSAALLPPSRLCTSARSAVQGGAICSKLGRQGGFLIRKKMEATQCAAYHNLHMHASADAGTLGAPARGHAGTPAASSTGCQMPSRPWQSPPHAAPLSPSCPISEPTAMSGRSHMIESFADVNISPHDGKRRLVVESVA